MNRFSHKRTIAPGLAASARIHNQAKAERIVLVQAEYGPKIQVAKKQLGTRVQEAENARRRISSNKQFIRQQQINRCFFSVVGACMIIGSLWLLVLVKALIVIPYLLISLATGYLGFRRLPKQIKIVDNEMEFYERLEEKAEEEIPLIKEYIKALECECAQKIKDIENS